VISKPEHEMTAGARPVGAQDEAAAARAVQRMFDTIAPRYDVLNHVLSAGIDRWWWNRAARSFRDTLRQPHRVVLDLCCGTGDMALALDKYRPRRDSAPAQTATAPTMPAPILAVDFSHNMLVRGAAKFASRNIIAIEADALHLPIASGSLDLVTSAFGFRNLANYEEGLAELFRVLAPGGQIGILDCNQPDGVVGALYSLYFKQVLPKLGGLISGDSGAYSYLPASVERFPRPPRMLHMICQAGFIQASWTSYTFGVAGLYRATKP